MPALLTKILINMEQLKTRMTKHRKSTLIEFGRW
jgi:hypothetical protein